MFKITQLIHHSTLIKSGFEDFLLKIIDCTFCVILENLSRFDANSDLSQMTAYTLATRNSAPVDEAFLIFSLR